MHQPGAPRAVGRLVHSAAEVVGRKGVALLATRRRVVADLIARILATPLDFTANESIETDPKKGWFTILRLYSPLEPFFTKAWQPSEIEAVD